MRDLKDWKRSLVKMAKKKLSTPDWILEGYDSPAEYNKAKGIVKERGNRDDLKVRSSGSKTFNIRECPKCGSDDVGVVVGEVGIWECHKCKWKGAEIIEKELTEDELMKYLDERGEETA
jgi:ribosomal protein L37AE/L43A